VGEVKLTYWWSGNRRAAGFLTAISHLGKERLQGTKTINESICKFKVCIISSFTTAPLKDSFPFNLRILAV